MTDLNFLVGCLASAVAGAALACTAVIDATRREILAANTDAAVRVARIAVPVQETRDALYDLNATVTALQLEIEETQRIARDGRQILAQLAGPAPVRFPSTTSAKPSER